LYDGFDALELMRANTKIRDLIRMDCILCVWFWTFNFQHLTLSAAYEQRVPSLQAGNYCTFPFNCF